MTAEKIGLFKQMREDAEAGLARDPSATRLRDIVLYSTGTHIVWAYRRQHWLYTHGMQDLALWLSKRMRRRMNADIHPAATIGRRFSIDHGAGVVIGGTAIIGDDCLIYQGVTLGMTGNKLEGKRHPTLGNNVMVGAGAIVLGDIHIGNNVKVGAGAVVVHDVPDDVTVVGVPATIVRERGCPMLNLIEGRLAAGDVDNENVRWSCGL